MGLAQAETQTTDAERDCLSRHAAGRRRLVEIGVWHGVTTCRLRKAMAPDAAIFAVDPYPRGRLGFNMHRIIAHREVARVPNGRVHWVPQTGAEAAASLRDYGPFDFVFIDGDHSYEGLQADWRGWRPLLAPGGIIALHDSRSTPERRIGDDAGSVRFTSEVILGDPDFTLAAAVDSLTVVRRLKGRLKRPLFRIPTGGSRRMMTWPRAIGRMSLPSAAKRFTGRVLHALGYQLNRHRPAHAGYGAGIHFVLSDLQSLHVHLSGAYVRLVSSYALHRSIRDFRRHRGMRCLEGRQHDDERHHLTTNGGDGPPDLHV